MSSHLENEEEYEEGEEWIFSYADLMSLMVGFFVILFLFAGPGTEEKKDMAQDVASSFKKDRAPVLSLEEAEKRSKILSKLLQLLGVSTADEAKAIARIQAIVEQNVGSDQRLDQLKQQFAGLSPFLFAYHEQGQPLRIVLPTQQIFEQGDDLEITRQAKGHLRELAQKIFHSGTSGSIVVEAHAGAREDALQVIDRTARQASRVAFLLREAGLPSERLRVGGLGAMRPLEVRLLRQKNVQVSALNEGRLEIWVY